MPSGRVTDIVGLENTGYANRNRLASGTADATTYLRGDQTWATPTATLADGAVTTSKLASDVTATLNGKAASSHSHTQSDITNLTTDLSGKASVSHVHVQLDVSGLTSDLAGKAAASHGHSQDDVTGLTVSLAAKAASSHTHAQEDITSLTADLAAKAAVSHVHTASDTTSGTLDIARLPTGATGTTVALGNHTHAGSGYTVVATLAGNQATGANTTPVTLTGLVFTYETNSKYRIWFMGRVQPTAATTGCGFQFDLSSAVTTINVQFVHQLASTGTLSGGHSIADDASVGVSSGMPATGGYPVTGFGLLVTTGNTGTAQLRFRSETTAVTTCLAGFTLVVEKIA